MTGGVAPPVVDDRRSRGPRARWIPRLNRDDPKVEARYQEIGFCKELLSDSALYASMLRAVVISRVKDSSVAKLETIKEIPA